MWIRSALAFFVAISLAGGGCTKQATGPEEMITANKELDRTFDEAFKAKDLEMMMKCWWKNSDAVLYPSDNIEGRKGWDEIKASVKLMVEGTEQVVSIKRINTKYVVLGDAVMGEGMLAMSIIPKGAPRQVDLLLRYTSLREIKEGRWVYVYRHESMNPMLGSDLSIGN